MECHTSACNTATSHIPGACMSNPRTQYPPFLWLFRNVYIVYALIHTYTSNSLKYASHNCKKESVHMQQIKRANKQTLYLQKFKCAELEPTGKISNLIYNDNIQWIYKMH